MRPCKLSGPANWMLVCGVLALLPAQAAAPGATLPRHRLCEPCAMPALPIVLPHKGLVMNYGSVMSSVSPWYVIDLESGEASRMLARGDAENGQSRLAIVEQTTRALPNHELARLRQINREIWALQDRLPQQLAAEVSWQLWLMEDGDVRYERAAGVPNGLSKEILLMMQRELERPASSE